MKTALQYFLRVPIHSERIEELLRVALEGGSNRWIAEFRWSKRGRRVEQPLRDIIEGDAIAEIQTIDGDVAILDDMSLRTGLDALHNYPTAVATVLVSSITPSPPASPETADVFLQLCLFGGIIYS